MKQKCIEIRDRGTCITAIAIKLKPTIWFEEPFLERGGWGPGNVILIDCNGGIKAHYDPFEWRSDGSRTMFEAHRYIVEHFSELQDFDIVDVEYILGEKDAKAVSNIIEIRRMK